MYYLHTDLAAAAQPGLRAFGSQRLHESLNIRTFSFRHFIIEVSRDGMESSNERGKAWQDLYDVEIFLCRELTLKSSPVSPPQLKPPFHA